MRFPPAAERCRCRFFGESDDVWGLHSKGQLGVGQLPPDTSRLWEPGVKKSGSGAASAPRGLWQRATEGSLQEMQSAGFPADGILSY